MCLILMAYKVHPRYPLVLAANRDEFYDRPTTAAGFWADDPNLCAGKDLRHGGTWLGVTRQGRVAAITNYRDPGSEMQDARSRGELVPGFLTSKLTAAEYLLRLREQGRAYNGFNLVVGDAEELCCFSNRSGTTERIEPGIHGLSNHHLDTPWPKVARGKKLLREAIAGGGEVSLERLFAILADYRQAPVEELPSTGVTLEWERMLSSIFICSPRYGTRASTVLLIDCAQRVTFAESTFSAGGGSGTREIRFSLENKNSGKEGRMD